MNPPQLPTEPSSAVPRRALTRVALVLALGALFGAGQLAGQRAGDKDVAETPPPLASTAKSRQTAESRSPNPQAVASSDSAQAASSATPRVATGMIDWIGRPVSVSCASCHANMEPDLTANSGDQLLEFHQGLKFAHGRLTCLACHHAQNYNQLRLAGEQPLDFSQAQTLCAQCHSKQHNDYQHGAHGGMNGHWNLERGGRVRKRCIDCHDPHAPSFPAMVPTFRSHDRFLETKHPSQPGARHE